MSARAPVRLYLSPATLGVVLDRGTPREDLSAVPDVLVRLRMKRGSCPLLKRLGSRLETLEKLDGTTKRFASDYCAEAVADLVERGDVRELVTDVQFSTGGRVTFVLHYRDRAGQAQAVPYTYRTGSR